MLVRTSVCYCGCGQHFGLGRTNGLRLRAIDLALNLKVVLRMQLRVRELYRSLQLLDDDSRSAWEVRIEHSRGWIVRLMRNAHDPRVQPPSEDILAAARSFARDGVTACVGILSMYDPDWLIAYTDSLRSQRYPTSQDGLEVWYQEARAGQALPFRDAVPPGEVKPEAPNPLWRPTN